ncbi:MAG: cation transporter [Acidobacteriota bacterium]|nr:cation transporter [Acidobacteriota bacterium]
MSELVKIEPLKKRREPNPPVSVSNRALLVKRGILLEYFTIGWNLLEGLVAVGAGIIAGSPSLVGFGIDSFIESTSGGSLLWRLRVDDEETRERREQIALRLVGASFLLLAAYVAYDSITTLVWRELPETSYIGIVLLIISLVVMPVLARAKRRVAVEIKSRALEADSKQTDLCVYLSAISLGGLALNAAFGWWWADPVAALIMVPIIVNEGIEGLRGETCCDDSCH